MEAPGLGTLRLKWEVMVINEAPGDVAVGGGITSLNTDGSQAPCFLSVSPDGHSLFLSGVCHSVLSTANY